MIVAAWLDMTFQKRNCFRELVFVMIPRHGLSFLALRVPLIA